MRAFLLPLRYQSDLNLHERTNLLMKEQFECPGRAIEKHSGLLNVNKKYSDAEDRARHTVTNC
jgi:hypothetical protein